MTFDEIVVLAGTIGLVALVLVLNHRGRRP